MTYILNGNQTVLLGCSSSPDKRKQQVCNSAHGSVQELTWTGTEVQAAKSNWLRAWTEVLQHQQFRQCDRSLAARGD
jgi:hypothetical protein